MFTFLSNSSSYLTIPTHDTSGQAIHPSVIDFTIEQGISTWGGYRYWMAMTPYPSGNDAHEDPNLVASTDGITWVVPTGLVNPLDDAPGGGPGYNADTDMVYNSSANQLWIYYRWYSSDTSTLEMRLVKVNPDMTYTTPQVVITVSPWSISADKIRSQFIWRETATKWHMWGQGGSRPYRLWYLSSTDGINWSTPVVCSDSKGNDPLHSINKENWHPCGKPNLVEKKMELLISSLELGQSEHFPPFLYYAEIPFDDPTRLILPSNRPVLQASSNGWDNNSIYRSSFVKDGHTFKIWYSARSSSNVWNTGFISGELPSGKVDFSSSDEIINIPLYNTSRDDSIGVRIHNETKYIKLCGTDSNNASKVRIMTNSGIRALER